MAVVVQSSSTTACAGLTDLFFEDEELLDTIFLCRTACVGCPFFDRCLDFAVNNFPEVEAGIFAGYPASARKLMYEGRLEVLDWRPVFDSSHRVVLGLPPVERCEHTETITSDTGLVCAGCGIKVKRLKR